MDTKCLLCCKRSGEYCRTKYFQQLVLKHLSVTVEGRLCICESCGQLLRHWDDFSAEAQANLSRKKYAEADSAGDFASGKSCDQETQTDFDVAPPHLSEHSYAKSPLPETKIFTNHEYCQVDSSCLALPEEAYGQYYQCHQNFENYSECSESEIKILDVCELKDEQWYDDDPDTQEEAKVGVFHWDPNVRIKEEPIDCEEGLDENVVWREDFLKQEISESSRQSFLKTEFSPKDESLCSSPVNPSSPTFEETVKQELADEKKPIMIPPPAVVPNAPAPLQQFSCPLCDKEFPHNDPLVQHLRTHENFFKPALHLCCPECNQEFQSEHILVEHIMEYHETNENGEICCVICGQKKCSRTDLKRHIIGCHFCSTPASGTKSVFETEEPPPKKEKQVPVSKKQQKTTIFSCKLCNVKLATKLKLKLHVEQKHKGKKIVMKKASEGVQKTQIATKPLVASKTEKAAKKLHFERNNRFYCKICMKSFPSERGTVCHITMVHKQQYDMPAKSVKSENNTGSFPCKKCNKVFIYRRRVKNHVCNPVSNNDQLTSSKNILTYANKYIRKKDGQYCCKFCTTKVNSYSGIVKHLKKFHTNICKTTEEEDEDNEKTPKAETKETSSESKETKKYAKKLKEPKTIEAELPPRDNNYIKMKRRPNFYACENCSRRFLKTKQLRIHRKKLCSKIAKNSHSSVHAYFMRRADHFLCNFCFKTENEFKFNRVEDIETHLTSDHNLMVEANIELLYVCKHCKQQYKAPAYLKQHIKLKHTLGPEDEQREAKSDADTSEPKERASESLSSPGRLFPCKKCGKKLPLKIALQRHMQLKHPEPLHIKTEPVEDPIPGPASPSEIVENKNVCNVCGKHFKLSIALSKHMSTHSDSQASQPEKPSSTITEPPAAVLQSDIPVPGNVILATQSSSAPTAIPASPVSVETFECQLCSKAFKDREQLQLHSKTHVIAKEDSEKKQCAQTSQPAKRSLLTCDNCDKGLTFFSQIGLDQHKRKCQKPSS